MCARTCKITRHQQHASDRCLHCAGASSVSLESYAVPADMIDLTGRMALVIGAGRGIGKAIACAYAQAGANLVLAARSGEELEATGDEIANHAGVGVTTWQIDATDGVALSEAFGTLEQLDILAYVAGTSAQVPAQDYDATLFDRIYRLNCHGLFQACALAYPFLKTSPFGGRVVAVASHLGHVALARRTVYCSSKAAVIQYIRALAVEWAPDRINANCIAPGYTATELANQVLSDPDFRAEVLSKTPLGFIGEPRDIAGAAVFLASGASRYMTGQTMTIDGGWSCA